MTVKALGRENPVAAFVGRLVAGVASFEGELVPFLQAIQQEFGYLPTDALERLSQTTPFTPAQIAGAATFYAQFRLEPAGRHRIKVCIGTACHVKGAPRLIDAFKRHLRIGEGEDTDPEGDFTVEGVACLGCCMLAPAVQIDQIIYGPVAPAQVGAVLADFLAGEEQSADTVEAGAADGSRGEIRVCLCSSCRAAGTDRIARAARETISEWGLPAHVREVSCTGLSFEAPVVDVAVAGSPAMFRYGRVTEGHIERIILRHFPPSGIIRKTSLRLGRVLDWAYLGAAASPPVRHLPDDGEVANFLGHQVRIATEQCGQLPPLDLQAYREAGGFAALDRCRRDLAPDAIIAEIGNSGLRGRGGGGYPTARKWQHVAAALGEEKYLICNADEGDPGAFMDRMILESFPFRVIEGMAIAARALDIRHGFVYIRAEYPLAVERLRRAVHICGQEKILDPSPDGENGLHIKVVEGAGAFVCGEETALIAAVEGGRGTPRLRPPYPARSGLWGQPTLVNNVETFAVLPWIIRNGAAAFSRIGPPGSPGTKTFALAGKIVHGGLVEVPMGMTIRRIVEEIGGGVGAGRTLKAVQIGGPSGGCVPASLADTPVDYSALAGVGAMMGSGGLVVLDNTDCMVDVARYFMEFIQHESCGKCTCCRIGTWELLEILRRLCAGKGRAGDVEEIRKLAETVGRGSLCGLGKTAANPVLSTLNYFASEYQAHIDGRCPAQKCHALIAYQVGDRCIGCTRCAQVCPVEAIAPVPYRRHHIDDQLCTRCDACRETCPQKAIQIVDRPLLR